MATLHARSAKWLNLAPAQAAMAGLGAETMGRYQAPGDIRHQVRTHSSSLDVGECGSDRVHTMDSLGVMLNYHK